jgi:hypothetical protein
VLAIRWIHGCTRTTVLVLDPRSPHPTTLLSSPQLLTFVGGSRRGDPRVTSLPRARGVSYFFYGPFLLRQSANQLMCSTIAPPPVPPVQSVRPSAIRTCAHASSPSPRSHLYRQPAGSFQKRSFLERGNSKRMAATTSSFFFCRVVPMSDNIHRSMAPSFIIHHFFLGVCCADQSHPGGGRKTPGPLSGWVNRKIG